MPGWNRISGMPLISKKKPTFITQGNTYEVNFDNCRAAVLGKRLRAKCSEGRQRAAGAGETEGTRRLQAAGYGRRYKTVGRGLC